MDGMQWMASAMNAARSQLETATQNLANVSSDGYRRFTTTLALSEQGLVARQERPFEQGALRHTGRDLDVAIVGEGHFQVGDVWTRSGAFVRDRDGYLTDDRGRRLMAACGPVRLPPDGTISPDGVIRAQGRVLDRIPLPAGSTLQTGALEASNVNAIGETLDVLNAQRAFETAQKVLVAIDGAREHAVNDVARLK
jgi:flagellar basal-body rod protein FlgF